MSSLAPMLRSSMRQSSTGQSVAAFERQQLPQRLITQGEVRQREARVLWLELPLHGPHHVPAST